jgi:adenylate cyclase
LKVFPVGFEIERKFLVRGDAWRDKAIHRTLIRQAYLGTASKSSIRVRISDDSVATLTIKSRPVELKRLELEYPIPVAEAEALIRLREGSVVEKLRHVVPWHDLAWEIDVFAGDNHGLVIAEIELRDAHQTVELPGWIGEEVTGRAQYYNSFLAHRPFCSWARFPETSALIAHHGAQPAYV